MPSTTGCASPKAAPSADRRQSAYTALRRASGTMGFDTAYGDGGAGCAPAPALPAAAASRHSPIRSGSRRTMMPPRLATTTEPVGVSCSPPQVP